VSSTEYIYLNSDPLNLLLKFTLQISAGRSDRYRKGLGTNGHNSTLQFLPPGGGEFRVDRRIITLSSQDSD